MWLFLFLLSWLIGYLFLSLFKRDFLLLEKIFLGFTLGIGIESLLMFFIGIVSIPLVQSNLLLANIPICLLLLFLLNIRRASFGGQKKIIYHKIAPFEILLILIILLTFFWSFSQTIFWPPWEWDTLALYDFRAKVISQTHSLAIGIFTSQPSLTAYNYVYPFSTSLMHSLIYIGGGSNPQFIYSFFYVSMVVLLYSCTRRKLSRLMSLILSALLASTPEVLFPSTIAYPNIPFAVYFSFSTIYFWEWLFYKKTSYFLISALLLGLSAWIRNTEPFWMVNIAFIFLYVFLVKRRIFLFTVYLLIFFPIQRLWPYYQKYIFSSQSSIVFSPPEAFNFDLSKLPDVLYFVLRYFIGDWFGYLLVLFIAVFLLWKSNFIKKFILVWLFGYLALSVIGTYFFAVSFPWWSEIGGSAQRVSVFFAPLLLYVVSLFWTEFQLFLKLPFREISLNFRIKKKRFKISKSF